METSAAGTHSPQRLPWSKSMLALCQASFGVALVTETFKNLIHSLGSSVATSLVVWEVWRWSAGVKSLSQPHG